MFNPIKLVSCLKFIGHATELQIVKSRMVKLTRREKGDVIDVVGVGGTQTTITNLTTIHTDNQTSCIHSSGDEKEPNKRTCICTTWPTWTWLTSMSQARGVQTTQHVMCAWAIVWCEVGQFIRGTSADRVMYPAVLATTPGSVGSYFMDKLLHFGEQSNARGTKCNMWKLPREGGIGKTWILYTLKAISQVRPIHQTDLNKFKLKSPNMQSSSQKICNVIL
jgi:hypothetical protein